MREQGVEGALHLLDGAPAVDQIGDPARPVLPAEVFGQEARCLGPTHECTGGALSDATDAERGERRAIRAVEVSRDGQTGHDLWRGLGPSF